MKSEPGQDDCEMNGANRPTPLRPSSSTGSATSETDQRLREVNDRAKARREENQPLKIAANIPMIRDLCQGSDAPERRPPDHREAWEVDEEAQRLDKARQAYVDAGCPKLHGRKIDFSASPAGWLEVRAQIVGKLGDGFTIALLGNRGPGKTQLAQQAIQAACQRGRTALYTRAMTIFLALRATYGTDASEQSVIDLYSKPDLLVIDELQERGDTPWEDRVLNHLIDIRHGELLGTLLVANLTPGAFKKSLGPTITERLRETGGIIECSWKSFR